MKMLNKVLPGLTTSGDAKRYDWSFEITINNKTRTHFQEVCVSTWIRVFTKSVKFMRRKIFFSEIFIFIEEILSTESVDIENRHFSQKFAFY